MSRSENLLKSAEVAKQLGVSLRTLASWRSAGIGPEYILLCKSGKGLRYRPTEIESWLEKRKVKTLKPWIELQGMQI